MATALKILADVGASVFWSVGTATAAGVLVTAIGGSESWVITAMALTWAVVFANVLFGRD